MVKHADIDHTGITGVGGDISAHTGDTSDAHDASAISVLDTAANFAGADVEAVLAELQDNIDAVVPGGTGEDPIADIFGAADTAYEFDSSSLAGLTAMGTPDVEDADTTIPDHYYVKESGAGYAWCGRYASIPSAPFTVIAKLDGSNYVANYNAACLFLGIATPGNMDAIVYGYNTSSRVISLERVTPTAFGSSVASGPTHLDLSALYLGIVVNSSSDVDYLWSFSGRIWRYIGEARNPGLTLGSVGIAVKSENGTWSASAAFDFLRIWNSAKSFPGT